MNSKRTLALLFILATAPALALAQEGGGGGSGSGGGGGSGGHGEGGGGAGCGDAFGDLVHILRDSTTGQPILQKRTIEEKGAEVAGYCPIAIRGDGTEIPFVDLSCDPAEPDAVIEVDYFGRLSGGRTKERNSRMHFDEVISSIKDPAVGRVGQDETGRMRLGYDCIPNAAGALRCAEWRVIDSPMENLALYTRLMKYGHLQTDPEELDTWAHGDPNAGPQKHPALGVEDYEKFDAGMRHLLPRGEDGYSPSETCFSGGSFYPECAKGERLGSRDFVRAASFLAGAANKTGVITIDLVQYMNRILKITRDTEMSTANVFTLPALIRDCGDDNNELPSPTSNGDCEIAPAAAGLAAPADERFVNFRATNYSRPAWRNRKLEVLQRVDASNWREERGVKLMDWLDFVNGKQAGAVRNIDGFVEASSDGLRSIEFVHNYAVPEDLWPGTP